MTGTGYAITPRRVAFDWRATPLHWIPGEPTATHVINVLQLLLPAGERWFVKVFNRGVAKGLLPTWRELGTAIPRYFRRSYHPSQEGSLRRAVEYLAASPAARAAAGAVGRAAMS
ncbi:metal-dependent hydrolase [Streptomyces sp. NPDC058525]|uniref:metal-dependent hydrolase n=1 Tax=unclassified Streptomyces TaxID=2593676 RepID=UPI00365FA532